MRRFRYGVVEEDNEIGQVTGLAWTEVGGELLRIEATLVPGKGIMTLTGHLGDVMKESIQAAMTVVRSRAAPWVSTPVSTRPSMRTYTFLKAQRPRMVRQPVLRCARRWFRH